MKNKYIIAILFIFLFSFIKPISSYAYNGYRFQGQNYGTFDYKDVAPMINARKGYMIVKLGTTETWYGKQDFVSNKYYNLSGIYKMKFDGLYTFEFYENNQLVQTTSYYNTQPPKIINVVKGKNIYEKVKVKL